MAGDIYGFAINVKGNAVKSITAIDQSLNKLQGKTQQSTGGIAKGFITASVAMKAFSMAMQGMKSIYNIGTQLEQTNMAFEVLLGNAERGNKMFQNLKRWADVTPFDNQTTYDAAKMLLNYGVAADNVIPYMNMLGDISGGNADRFNRLTYVFGQMSAQGRLTGQDLRQMIDAGFNPLQEISKQTGKSYTELRDELSKGNISFEQVVSTMKAVTSEGGRFNGMMIKQSQTVAGLASTLGGSLQTAAYGLFQSTSPLMKEILQATADTAQAFAEWVTPSRAEELQKQQVELNGMFNALQNVNMTSEARANIISRLNGEYGAYLKNALTEKSTLNDIALAQSYANNEMVKKIKLAGQEEALTKYMKEAQRGATEEAEAAIMLEKAKRGELTYGDELAASFKGRKTGESEVEFYTRKQQEAKEFSMARQYQYQKWKDFLVQSSPELFEGFGGAQTVIPINDVNNAIQENAKSTSTKASSSAGIGEGKIINLNFTEPLLQVNADSIDSDGLQDNAEKAVELITRELVNLSHESGIM